MPVAADLRRRTRRKRDGPGVTQPIQRMRLVEAILERNHRRADARDPLDPAPHADSLPVVVLSCVDARLNELLPAALGLPADQIIWVRTPGNLVTGPLASAVRSLALACSLEGGREILIIGHSDCRLCRSGMVELLAGFERLGVRRERLPENVREFFGLFASEEQNVRQGAESVRNSPLIAARVAVHGLLVDTATGRLNWLVNGYQTTPATETVAGRVRQAIKTAGDVIGAVGDLPAIQFSMPEVRIGSFTVPGFGNLSGDGESLDTKDDEAVGTRATSAPPPDLPRPPALDWRLFIEPERIYRVIGEDKKVYATAGRKLLHWLAEKRVDGSTPVQVDDGGAWHKLEQIGELVRETVTAKRRRR